MSLLPLISSYSCCHLEYQKRDGTIQFFLWWLFGEPLARLLRRKKDIPWWKMVHQRYFPHVLVCIQRHLNTVLQRSIHVLDCLNQWWVLASSLFWHQDTRERSALYLAVFSRPWLTFKEAHYQWWHSAYHSGINGYSCNWTKDTSQMAFSCSLLLKKYSSHALHWYIWSESAHLLQVSPICQVPWFFPLMVPTL